MRNLLLGVLFGALACGTLKTASSEAQAQNQQSTKGIFYVTGTGWQTCSDWKDSSESFKIGYVMGHGEAVSQLIQIVGTWTSPSASQVKEAFDVPAGLKYGDEIKSVDAFCLDYRNLRIPLVNVIGIVMSDLSGRPAFDDKALRTYRCFAAAGVDQTKMRDCYTQANSQP